MTWPVSNVSSADSIDYEARWNRAGMLMRAHGMDAVFVMKPTNLAYLTGDGRPCALGLLTSDGQFVVAVPECDLSSVRAASHARDVRTFRSEDEMFHGFRDVLAELDLTEKTVGLEKDFFDAALHEVFAEHILSDATVVSATPVLSALRMLKDDHEVALLRDAARVADRGMLGRCLPGVSRHRDTPVVRCTNSTRVQRVPLSAITVSPGGGPWG